MWIFNKTRIINEECLDLVLRNQDKIKILKMSSPTIIGPSYDERKYTHKVGLFIPITTVETPAMYPIVYWYCRSDGNIWGEWEIKLTKRSMPMWPDNSKLANRLPMDTELSYTMRDEYKHFMNKLSKEHFAMHLLRHG
jgi:hypothetical protein